MKLLEERNSHERDSQLTFNEDLHLYSLNDGRNLTSVTSVIASLFPKFNPDFVIQKMKSLLQHLTELTNKLTKI